MSRFFLFIGSISTLVVLVILLSLPSPRLVLPIPQSYTKVISDEQKEVDFQDVSLDWEVVATHTQSSKHLTALTETLGSGICVFDFNQDGWMDIFFVGGSGHSRYYGKKSWWNNSGGNRLLLNMDGKRFEDVTEQAGFTKRIWGMGCATADLNNDGLSDLLVTGINSNTLYQNNGDGTFNDVTAQSSIVSNRWSTGASLGDFNKDGLLDIYVSNYIRYQKGAKTFERASGFMSTGKVAFDPSLYDPEFNQLYINKGDFVFEDVAQEAGVKNSLGRSLGTRWIDLNNDSWLDLVIINDHSSPNQVFINHKGLKFSRGKEQYASFEVAGSHDLIVADFNNSGQNDFFLSRGMSHPPVVLSKNLNNTDNETSPYTDSAWSSGLAQARLLPFTGWGSSAGDFNNDGFLDLYVGNGMKMPDTDTNFVAQAQQNSLFINQRNGQFKLSNGTNAAQHPYSSRGVISVDLNNDGTLEVLVSNNNDSLQILENQVSNEHTWFGLDLLSKNVPSDAYGAVVEVSTDLFTFKRTFGANQSFLSQGDPRVHIGLGDSKHIKSLNIRWPDGQVSTFENLKTNQYFTIGRTDNTLSPIQGEQTELTHKSPLLKQLNEAALIAYSKVLLQAPIGKTRNKLWQVWREGSDSVKSSILRHIEQHGDMHYVSLVRNALVNHDVDVQLLAAKILKQAELESSIVWLLPLLNDPKPPVQCATAQAFGFFFDEEEAVTHRKKLAISPLIKLLESGSPTAQVCAANALANAENKRAILPLLKLSTESAPTQVRTAAIRALGLIRDTSAREKLITLVQTPESKAPVVAASLIALNRLNEPTLDTLMSTHFNHDKDTTIKAWSILKRYQILSFLFTHPDGIVFPKRQLREKLTRLIKQDSSQRNITKLLNQKHLIAAFIAIGAGKLTSQLSFVESGLKHKDRDVQVQALTALVALNSPKASYLLEQTLSNQALNVFHEFISKSKSTSLPFSEKFLSQLAIRAADKPKQIDQLIELLLALPDNTANRLFNTLLTQELSIAQRQQLLEICVSEDATLSLTTQLTASEVRSKYPSDELRYAYANCYLNSPQPKNGNLTQLKKRLVLKSFMAETAWDEHSKTKLLLKAAETDRVTAKTMLLKRVLSSNTRPMPASQKAKALDVLAHHGLTSDIKEILWAMLKNTQLSHQTQLEAAALLTPIDAEAVLNFLDKQFYTP